ELPESWLVVSGGANQEDPLANAVVVGRTARQLGVDGGRLVIEDRPRDTVEEAVERGRTQLAGFWYSGIADMRIPQHHHKLDLLPLLFRKLLDMQGWILPLQRREPTAGRQTIAKEAKDAQASQQGDNSQSSQTEQDKG
ncbi:YdcF family protein, partial [Desulfobulbus sp. F1]|nr:YdcF family protein [Desulfobulbus sp. F1]